MCFIKKISTLFEINKIASRVKKNECTLIFKEILEQLVQKNLLNNQQMLNIVHNIAKYEHVKDLNGFLIELYSIIHLK